MFKGVIETDKYGRQQTRFYLTQGDSCVIYATPYGKNGEKIPLENVRECIFKIGNLDYELELKKYCVKVDDHFVLRLSSEETKNLDVDRHIYEFEYTLLGGSVNTPNQYYLEISEQIKKL